MRYFVTADTHYGHGNIIKYANRPFESAEEMNAQLIKKFNERVTPDDLTFFVGDFCFKSGTNCVKSKFWLDQLNGQKIMIRGNHDNNNSTKTCIDCIHITYAEKRINLCHKPEHSNPNFEINIVGHVHQNWKIRTFKEHYDILLSICTKTEERKDFDKFLNENYNNRNSESVLINVGVDVQRYMPITIDEAISQVARYKKGVE